MSHQQPIYTSYHYPPRSCRHGQKTSQSSAKAPRRRSRSSNTTRDAYSGRRREYDSNDRLVPGGVAPDKGEELRRIPRLLPDSQYSTEQNNQLNDMIESTMTVLRPPSNQPSSRRTSSNPRPRYQQQPHKYQKQSYMDRSHYEQPSSPDNHQSRQRGNSDSEDPGPVIEDFESDDGEEVKPEVRLLTWLGSTRTASVQGDSRRGL
jgi:hypothetical protein